MRGSHEDDEDLINARVEQTIRALSPEQLAAYKAQLENDIANPQPLPNIDPVYAAEVLAEELKLKNGILSEIVRNELEKRN